MIVRPARPDEAPAVSALALRAKARWGYDDAFLEACRHELTWTPERMREHQVLVAEDDGVLVAVTELRAAEGVLTGVFVDPARHGAGVGRALLEAALVRCRQAGVGALTVAADPNAEGFYRALGASRVGAVPSGTVEGRMLPLLRFDLP